MVLDLHVIQALSAGFKYYKEREADFKALFVGVGEATLTAWFADFSGEHYPAVRSRHAQGTAQAPLVTVIPQAETVTQELLGDFGGVDSASQAVDTYMISESVELALFARAPDMARVYHVLSRASLALARRPMHRAGYHVFRYDGSDPLTPEEELASEELGITVKRLRVRGEYQVRIPIPQNAEYGDSPTYSLDNVLVLSDTYTTDDGHQGGVTPSDS
jgi:hypothetical protein